MELYEFIRRQIIGTHWGWDDMLAGLTEEQFNWTPPGTTNSIAATALHAFGVGDDIIQCNLMRSLCYSIQKINQARKLR